MERWKQKVPHIVSVIDVTMNLAEVPPHERLPLLLGVVLRTMHNSKLSHPEIKSQLAKAIDQALSQIEEEGKPKILV